MSDPEAGGEKGERSEGFSIWLTSEPGAQNPLELVQSLFVVAWDALETIVQGPKPKKEGEEQLNFTVGSLHNVLYSGKH